jgi:hypothetical protein
MRTPVDTGIGEEGIQLSVPINGRCYVALHLRFIGDVGDDVADRLVADLVGCRDCLRSTIRTYAPSDANSLAVSMPIPPAPPVISATLSLSLGILCLP